MTYEYMRVVKKIDHDGIIRDVIELYDEDSRGEYNRKIINSSEEFPQGTDVMRIATERFEKERDEAEKKKREFERRGRECVIIDGSVVSIVRKRYFEFEK